MSIALTVVLRPSKILQISAIFFSVLLVFIVIHVGRDASLPLHFRLALTFLCLVSSSAIILYIRIYIKKQWHIAISGQGEFRCRLKTNALESKRTQVLHPYCLTSGTTLWSQMLFLRLRRLDNDDMINLVIPSDALDKDEFRRLSVACRWIARHAK
jgi:toxin CptA